jgi:DNA-binding transcriptional regulator YdaS (Cro superfamily)
MDTLLTHAEVIAALGGPTAMARLLGKHKAQVVDNWRRRERFPPETFLAIQQALLIRGKSAPPDLWCMDDPFGSRLSAQKVA